MKFLLSSLVTVSLTFFPNQVFENILNHHIEWPEEEESLSQAAMETILALLRTDPATRADGVQVKAMELTNEVCKSTCMLPWKLLSTFLG